MVDVRRAFWEGLHEWSKVIEGEAIRRRRRRDTRVRDEARCWKACRARPQSLVFPLWVPKGGGAQE